MKLQVTTMFLVIFLTFCVWCYSQSGCLIMHLMSWLRHFNSSSSDTLGWKLRVAALHRKDWGVQPGGKKQQVGKEAEEEARYENLLYMHKSRKV